MEKKTFCYCSEYVIKHREQNLVPNATKNIFAQ